MNAPQTSSVTESTETNGATGAFSPEVIAFAKAHQAEHCLQPLLEATHRIFPMARSIEVRVGEDPELCDNTQIVFRVQMAGLSLDEIQATRRQWHEALFSLYRPTHHLVYCLQLKLTD